MKKILVLLLAMTFLVGCTNGNNTNVGVAAVKEEPTTAVAVVDGEEIDITVFDKYYAMQSYDFEKEFGKSVWDIEKDGLSMREIRQNQTLDYLVTVNLIEKYVKDKGVTADQVVINDAYEKYMASLSTDLDIKAYFNDHGIEEGFLKRFITDQYYLRQYEVLILDEIKNDPETEAKLFAERIIRYKTRHILLDDEETLAEVLAQLNNEEEPADFSDMARLYSIHSTSAVKGGDLGYIIVGNMPKAYEDVALSIEQYTVSDPVETEYGTHLIFVDDRQTLQDMMDQGLPEDEINMYKDEIIERFAATETVRILESLKSDATIDYNKDLINGN